MHLQQFQPQGFHLNQRFNQCFSVNIPKQICVGGDYLLTLLWNAHIFDHHQDIIINGGGLSISLSRPSHFLQVWLLVDSLHLVPVFVVFVYLYLYLCLSLSLSSQGHQDITINRGRLSISLCGPSHFLQVLLPVGRFIRIPGYNCWQLFVNFEPSHCSAHLYASHQGIIINRGRLSISLCGPSHFLQV